MNAPRIHNVVCEHNYVYQQGDKDRLKTLFGWPSAVSHRFLCFASHCWFLWLWNHRQTAPSAERERQRQERLCTIVSWKRRWAWRMLWRQKTRLSRATTALLKLRRRRRHARWRFLGGKLSSDSFSGFPFCFDDDDADSNVWILYVLQRLSSYGYKVRRLLLDTFELVKVLRKTVHSSFSRKVVWSDFFPGILTRLQSKRYGVSFRFSNAILRGIFFIKLLNPMEIREFRPIGIVLVVCLRVILKRHNLWVDAVQQLHSVSDVKFAEFF